MDQFKPRRLRICEPGLIGYTGLLGSHEFVDGDSLHKIGWQDANHLGASMQIVDADEPDWVVNPSLDRSRMADTTPDAPEVVARDSGVKIDGEVKLALDHLTREELEKIADHEGLAGVRELANRRGGTGRSIAQCIEFILDSQGEEAQTGVKPTAYVAPVREKAEKAEVVETPAESDDAS